MVLCPLLILYAFGYIFNPIKQEITQTGLIYLSTTPPGANIYLWKSRYKHKTPASITELKPGKYEITLKLKRYKSWMHSISVDAEKAAAFEDILLIPKTWQKKAIIQEKFISLNPLDKADFFLLAKDKNLGSYICYDWRNNKITPILPTSADLFDMPVISIFEHQKEPRFIVYGGSLWNKESAYIRFINGSLEIVDITNLIQGEPIGMVWDEKDKNDIFMVYKNYVNRINIKSMTVSPRYIENIKGCGLYGNWIYTVDNKGSINMLTMGKEKIKTLSAEKQLGYQLLEKSDFWKISILWKDIFLFMGKQGQLVVNVAPYELSKNGAKGFKLYENKRKLLFWKNKSIGIADFKLNGGSSLFKTDVIVKTIYDEGENITNCFLIDERHIVFCDYNKLYLLEVEPQGEHHIELICEIQKNSSIFYSNEKRSIYYLDSQTGYLNLIEVIPERRLPSIPPIEKEAEDNNHI